MWDDEKKDAHLQSWAYWVDGERGAEAEGNCPHDGFPSKIKFDADGAPSPSSNLYPVPVTRILLFTGMSTSNDATNT